MPEPFPLMNELGWTEDTSSSSATISPLQVLHYLLREHVISEDTIRNAVHALSTPSQSTPTGEETDAPSSSQTSLLKQQASCPAPAPPPAATRKNRTRHVALRFSYDGADFSGLAQNVGTDSDRSVERALFQALVKAQLVESRDTSRYSRCGRTDRGVSAAGQVVAMHLKSAIPLDASLDPEGRQPLDPRHLPKNEHQRILAWVFPRRNNNNNNNNHRSQKNQQRTGEEGLSAAAAAGGACDNGRVEKELSEYPYAKILNNLLPPEIRVLGWAPVSDEFSARFSATTRTYRYFFVQRQLNLERMQQGLECLVGKHDFRNFCKMDVEKVYNFERVIHSVQLVVVRRATHAVEESGGTPPSVDEQMCYVQIHGQAFLWHQIRCIMEVLFMIGNGLEDPSVITEMFDIDTHPGKPNYPLAPEKPLVLNDCGYPNLQFGYSVQNVWTVMCQLEQQWEALALAAARIRNGIDGLREVPVMKEDLLQFAMAKVVERKRKLGKSGIKASLEVNESKLSSTLPHHHGTFLSWEDGLQWLRKECQLIPDSNGLNTSIHIPLLKRSRGTTYEQKITALQKSDKRRIKYEESVVKKRKSPEEDAAFYNHMAKQGGTGV